MTCSTVFPGVRGHLNSVAPRGHDGGPRTLVLGVSRILLATVLTALVLSPSTAAAGDPKGKVGKEWQTWRDPVRNILKIEYRAGEDASFEFKVYRNKDWNGQGNEFDELETFTITEKSPRHSKHWPEFYTSLLGPIDVTYEVTADYQGRKVRSKGVVKAPNPGPPITTQEKKWDQDFFDIPTPDNVIVTHKDGYDYVEVSEVWTGFCSDFACGSWVSFNGYTEAHRYDVDIPGIGKVIVQLWKGPCPRFSDIVDTQRFKKWNFGGQYPGGIGAEVGLYRPRDDGSMMDAAKADNWVPVVDPRIRISFQLIDPKTGHVLVDAEEKQTWWRTKWITKESFEKYKGSVKVPANLLDYELHYKINGVEQPPWKYSGDPGVYDLGLDGVWMRVADPMDLQSALVRDTAGSPHWIEIHREGKSVRLATESMSSLTLTPGGGPVAGSDASGEFQLTAEESGADLTLHFDYTSVLAKDRTVKLVLDRDQVLTVSGYGNGAVESRLLYAPK